jgi:DNA-binding MarR family transcriptional regulator
MNTRAARYETLNHFFVGTFNQILAWEERSMRAAGLVNLSVKELHALEAVHELAEKKQNTMSQIAARMDISVGALTTAVNVLVRKGYLTRGGDENDRRIVYIYPTKSGEEALKIHEEFHRRMIGEIMNVLDDASIAALTASVDQLDRFFQNLIQEQQE